MIFKKANLQREIRKAIENDKQLDKHICEADIKYELIQTIVKTRKDMDITQQEVSEKSGLTQQMVSRIENLDNSPTLDNFIKYLTALGLKINIDKIKI